MSETVKSFDEYKAKYFPSDRKCCRCKKWKNAVKDYIADFGICIECMACVELGDDD